MNLYSCFESVSTEIADSECMCPACASNLKRETMMKDKMYLGDGVYVSHDGYNLILTNENGVDVLSTIFLENNMVAFLQKYLDEVVNKHETGVATE